MSLVAPQHVESSQTRDRTRVSCIGRQTLHHRATRKAPELQFQVKLSRKTSLRKWLLSKDLKKVRVQANLSESVSRSVVSNSLQLHAINCCPPGSSVHGISQVKILECIAISPSRGSSRHKEWIHISGLASGFFTTEPRWKPKCPILRDNWKQNYNIPKLMDWHVESVLREIFIVGKKPILKKTERSQINNLTLKFE